MFFFFFFFLLLLIIITDEYYYGGTVALLLQAHLTMWQVTQCASVLLSNITTRRYSYWYWYWGRACPVQSLHMERQPKQKSLEFTTEGAYLRGVLYGRRQGVPSFCRSHRGNAQSPSAEQHACTLWVQKTGPFSFEHNYCKYCPILIILSLLQTEIICRKIVIEFPTSSIVCCCTTLKNAIYFFTKTVE